MLLREMLQIEKGVTAIVGSGGKTSLMTALSGELSRQGKVIVCTTTHIARPKQIPCLLNEDCRQAERYLQTHELVCLGSQTPDGKLTAPPVAYAELCKWADFVLVEADGSRGLPAKAHDAHEPVIPPQAGQTVCVFGMRAIGGIIAEVVHRPSVFAAQMHVRVSDVLTVRLAAEHLRLERCYTRVFLNQTDDPETAEKAKELAGLLDCPVCMGSLQKGIFECLC